MLPDLLRFRPVMVPRPWGGSRLDDRGPIPIGERWDVADLPDGAAGDVADPRSRVRDGALEGMAPSDLVTRYGSLFLGSASPGSEGRLPLLVKVLDARENLSVQVHPPLDYVEEHPETRLKHESWYLLDGEEGARLFLDLVEGADRHTVDEALGTPAIVELLRTVPARRGEFHHLPAGRIHALGAGAMVLEVQTPSDTTFRIYDWSVEYRRAPRTLHVEEARASLLRTPAAPGLPPLDHPGSRDLVRTEHYWMREHRGPGSVSLDPHQELRVLNMARGSMVIGDESLSQWETVVLPASSRLIGPVEVPTGGVLVETGLV